VLAQLQPAVFEASPHGEPLKAVCKLYLTASKGNAGYKGANTMTKTTNHRMNQQRIYRIVFGSVYPMYIQKAENKGRTREEVDEIIFWLTGYNKQTLQQQIDSKNDFETFFDQAPQMNPHAAKITGVICGYRVEEIEDKLVQNARYLDKLIDELAKGKPMDKILRK